MKIKIWGHLTTLCMVFQSSFLILVPHMAVYKSLPVIGPQWVKKTLVWKILLLSRQSSIFHLPYFPKTVPQNLVCCKIFNVSLKDESISF